MYRIFLILWLSVALSGCITKHKVERWLVNNPEYSTPIEKEEEHLIVVDSILRIAPKSTSIITEVKDTFYVAENGVGITTDYDSSNNTIFIKADCPEDSIRFIDSIRFTDVDTSLLFQYDGCTKQEKRHIKQAGRLEGIIFVLVIILMFYVLKAKIWPILKSSTLIKNLLKVISNII